MDIPCTKPSEPRANPDTVVLGFLSIECLLWLADRFCRFPFDWQSGWPVLVAIGVGLLAWLVLFLWFAASLIFHWPFFFRGRSLLALVLVVAAPFGWLTVKMTETNKKAMREREAIATIERLGGRVIWSHPVSPETAWLYGLLGNEFFGSVDTVVLSETNVTDADLKLLETLNQLDHLYLAATQITDIGLGILKNFHQLHHLNISGTQITDVGLDHLKGLNQLHDLYLCSTQITDAGLKHLHGLSQLRLLELSDNRVTDAAVNYLKDMDHLYLLCLYRTRITNEGFEKLQSALPQCAINR